MPTCPRPDLPHDHATPDPTGSPLGWSAARRLTWAAGFCALLWLAVSWALGWWS